jgi:hypothetical protein
MPPNTNHKISVNGPTTYTALCPHITPNNGSRPTQPIISTKKPSAGAPTITAKTSAALTIMGCLTMRLSDARLRRRQTKLIYPNHRPSPWLTEDATPRSLEPIVRSQPCHDAGQTNSVDRRRSPNARSREPVTPCDATDAAGQQYQYSEILFRKATSN